MDEQLLDFGRDAHALRIAGYSEARIARAAGFPELAPTQPKPTVDHIIEIVLRRPLRELSPDDRAWWRSTVKRILTAAHPQTAVTEPPHPTPPRAANAR